MKWRAELRERELERMSGLEGEWRRREAARTAEVAKIKTHYADLDTQTRQVGSTRHCLAQATVGAKGRGRVGRVEGRGYRVGGRGAQQATGPCGHRGLSPSTQPLLCSCCLLIHWLIPRYIIPTCKAISLSLDAAHGICTTVLHNTQCDSAVITKDGEPTSSCTS